MAPSAVNDSARAMMASVAKWRDDITGILTTGGSGTAYTITSNQVQASNLDGYTVQFTPGTTNTGAVTLSVDSQTARPLRFYTGVELPAGVLIAGSLYQATYRVSSTEWLLHSFDASIYSIPLGGVIDFTGTTAPNGAFVLPYGQQVSQSTYATLYALYGSNRYGADGGGLFYLPDLRGRVVAGKDDMGGSSANRLTDADDGLNGDTLGDTGGGETQTLVTANLPAYTPSGTVATTVTMNSNAAVAIIASAAGANPFGGSAGSANSTAAITATASSTLTGAAQGGTSTAFGIVQPTIILNKLLRII
jgi:microcystin-dependent protein